MYTYSVVYESVLLSAKRISITCSDAVKEFSQVGNSAGEGSSQVVAGGGDIFKLVTPYFGDTDEICPLKSFTGV